MKNSDSSNNTQQIDADRQTAPQAPEKQNASDQPAQDSDAQQIDADKDGQTAPQAPEKQNASDQAKQDDANSEPKKHPRRRLLLIILLGVGVIAAAIFGYRWWRYASTHADTDDAYVTGHLHQINSRINDTVAQVLVNDNQFVHQGQLLVKLDPHDFQVQVQMAQAI